MSTWLSNFLYFMAGFVACGALVAIGVFVSSVMVAAETDKRTDKLIDELRGDRLDAQ